MEKLSRRKFLKATGLAGLGVALSACTRSFPEGRGSVTIATPTPEPTATPTPEPTEITCPINDSKGRILNPEASKNSDGCVYNELPPTSTPLESTAIVELADELRNGNVLVLTKKDGKEALIPNNTILGFLDDLKQNGYPVDQWNQWAETRTFDGAEVTAGENWQASIKLDLWRDDGKTPWGKAEISTIVHRGQSIALKKGFRGTGWIYPQDEHGNGWKPEFVAVDTIAGLGRRVLSGENIAETLYMKLPDGRYQLQLRDSKGNYFVVWTGEGDKRDDLMIGIRGFVPLQALLDLGLAKDRYADRVTPTTTTTVIPTPTP